ncbi:MAG: hypothetical protein VXY16_11665 [Pseudomonadota bacterium]|nr:hypothetical protein [Pseudomonadota bacterium]
MNKLLLISLFLGALIIIGAIMMAKGGGAPEDVALADGNAVVPLSYQLCAPGDQCIVVDRNCGFCCNYIAINSRNEDDFNALFDKSCSIFDGQSCNCYDLNSYPSCVENKCEMVPFPDAR